MKAQIIAQGLFQKINGKDFQVVYIIVEGNRYEGFMSCKKHNNLPLKGDN